jgi:PAS domain S-box-containing protein
MDRTDLSNGRPPPREVKLEDRDRHLATIYGSVSDALFLLAVDGGDRYRFLTVNRTFLQLTGLTEPQIYGRTLDEVLPAAALPGILEHYRQAIAGGTTARWEEVTEFPAGTRYGEVSVTPIFDDNARCTNIVGTVRDLT